MDGKDSIKLQDPLLMSKLQTYKPEISGPQIVYEGESIHLELRNRSKEVASLRWRVDNIVLPSQSDQVSFDAQMTDAHRIDLELFLKNEEIIKTSYFVTVIGFQDGLSCLKDLKINAQTTFYSDELVAAELAIPSCLTKRISGARWSIQNRDPISDVTVAHNFGILPEGQYIIVAEIFSDNQKDRLFTLRYGVRVLTRPEQEEIPHICPTGGMERSVSETEETIEVSCGLGGKKNQTRKTTLKEVCQLGAKGNLIWIPTPVQTRIVSETGCLGQACILISGDDGSELLVDGQLKTGLPNGEQLENLICSHQEEGYFKKHQVLKDVKCNNGALEITQVYQSALIDEKLCPKYSWIPLKDWTTCSADCGGEQTRKYECIDQYQNTSQSSRCTEVLVPEQRVCDKNSEAAAYEIKTESQEQVPSSKRCSGNQIGTIIQTRTATKIEKYACVAHQISKVDEVVNFSGWVTESLCRDYVASRCSHDSISIEQARNRYQWMLKCQSVLPEVKRFLDQHTEFGIRDRQGRSFDTKRPLYASFMKIRNGKEVVWRAPVVAGSECSMPNSAFVAAVCVSSCATPDQHVMVKEHPSSLPTFMRFDEVHSKKLALVMTLRSPVFKANGNLTHSKVDQWVTEVVDTEHDIKVIVLKSGGQLKLTPNHPMVMPDGSLKLVQDLRVGESLVKSNSSLDPVISIQDIKFYGKVYNVFTQSASPQHNIVFINGYMSGSAMFQNEAANLINRRIFRSKLTQGAK